VLASFSAFAGIGLLWYMLSVKTSAWRPESLFLASWALLTLAVYVVYNFKYVQFQGRYLFPALIPIGLAFTVGLRQWTMLLPRAWRSPALAMPFVGLAALCLVALFRMIVPMLSP
jgi:hypothetical protein